MGDVPTLLWWTLVTMVAASVVALAYGLWEAWTEREDVE